MEKECAYCQKTFTVKRIDSVYCSRSCRQMAYMVRRMDRSKNVVLQGINAEMEPPAIQIPEIFLGPDLPAEIDMDRAISELQQKEKKDQTAEYEPAQSAFLNTIRERIDEGRNLSILQFCIETQENLSSYWVALRMRCLVECLLLFSEAKYAKVADLMEICNGFTLLQRSISFKNLPGIFPYIDEIFDIKEKLRNLCLKVQKADQIRFSLRQEDKINLIATRFELAQYIPKRKFSQLDFDG